MPAIDAPIRNVAFDPAVEVRDWDQEVIETVIDRGSLSDWRLLATEIRRQPWGRVARIVESISSWGEHYGADALFAGAVTAARRRVDDEARMAAARGLRSARRRVKLTLKDAARLAGTSEATLSAYETGRVAPTSTVLGRIHRVLEG